MSLVHELHRKHLERRARLDGGKRPDKAPKLISPPVSATPGEMSAKVTGTFGYVFGAAPKVSFDPVVTKYITPFPGISLIQKHVCRHYGVERLDMLSSRRASNIVFVRQVGMYLSKKLTPRSLPEIGRQFGGKDHTTALHAIRKIQAMAAADPQLAEVLQSLSLSINREWRGV